MLFVLQCSLEKKCVSSPAGLYCFQIMMQQYMIDFLVDILIAMWDEIKKRRV